MDEVILFLLNHGGFWTLDSVIDFVTTYPIEADTLVTKIKEDDKALKNYLKSIAAKGQNALFE